jgi:hypothetical protein
LSAELVRRRTTSGAVAVRRCHHSPGVNRLAIGITSCRVPKHECEARAVALPLIRRLDSRRVQVDLDGHAPSTAGEGDGLGLRARAVEAAAPLASLGQGFQGGGGVDRDDPDPVSARASTGARSESNGARAGLAAYGWKSLTLPKIGAACSTSTSSCESRIPRASLGSLAANDLVASQFQLKSGAREVFNDLVRITCTSYRDSVLEIYSRLARIRTLFKLDPCSVDRKTQISSRSWF